MSVPFISMIWSPGCRRPSPATSPSGNTSCINQSALSRGQCQPITAHLDHDAAEGRVGPAHDGDAEAGGGAGDLHVGHLALQDGQPRDACTQRYIVIIKTLSRSGDAL